MAIIQVLRSNSTGSRPTGKQSGEPYVNFADKQYGVFDGVTSQDLIGVRYFSTQANYKVGDCVSQGNNLYIANATIIAGAFNATNWNRVILSTDAINYLPIAGGTLTGTLNVNLTTNIPAISLNASASNPMYIASNRGAGRWRWYLNMGTATPESGSNVGSDFAITRFTDAGVAIDTPFAINRATGNVTVGGSGTLVIDGPAPPSGSRYIYGTTVGITRWILALGTTEVEGVSNAGSNLAIYNYDNNGALLGTPLSINRASGAATFGTTIVTPSLAASSSIATNGLYTVDSNGSRAYYGRTATSIARWLMELGNATAESGSNAGSDFAISRYADGTGAYLGTPFTINRASGNAAFGNALNIGGSLTISGGISNYGSHNYYPSGGSNSIIQFYNASGTSRGYVGWLNNDAGIYLVNNTSGAYIFLPIASATVSLAGAVSMNSSLSVAAGVTVSGSQTVAGNFSCSNTITCANETVNSGLTVGGNIQCNNNVNCNTLSVAGTSSLSGTVSCNQLNSSGLYANGTINAQGNSFAHGAFYCDNAAGGYFQRDVNGNFYMQVYGNTSNQVYLVNNRTGANIELDGGGSFISSSNNTFRPVSGPWFATSDKRIKNVIGEYKAGLKEVLRINPLRFTFKGNHKRTKDGERLHVKLAEENKEFVGLLADDLMKILPETVWVENGFIDDKEVDDIKQMDIGNITYALVNAIKELQAEILILQARGR